MMSYTGLEEIDMGNIMGRLAPTAKGWSEPKLIDGWNVQTKMSTNGWVNLKVSKDGRARGKGNYWLSYSVTERRFAETQVVRDAQESKPKILEMAALAALNAHGGS